MSQSPDNLPPYAPVQTPYDPSQTGPKPGSSGLTIVLVVLGCTFAGLFLCGGIMVALLLPAVSSAREAARRMQCSNNMKMISLGLFNYEAEYGCFPPAFTVDENGNRLHSWRTLILPYLEEQSIYDQIDLSKPWDDPANAILRRSAIATYTCPSNNAPSTTKTRYLTILGSDTIFSGSTPTRLREITDGMSNTVMVIEVDDEHSVDWFEPEDLLIDDFIHGKEGNGHTNGSNMAYADGSVMFLRPSAGGEIRSAIATKSGGEIVPHVE